MLKEVRTRAWTCVVYPDSLPANWTDILDDLHLEWVQSPLHDKDVNATGEPKKSHYHLLFLFAGVKSFEQIKEITDLLNAPIPQVCHNSRSLVRYMIHLDNPDKYQYNKSDIISHGGVEIDEFLRPTSSIRYEIIKDMISFVQREGITEYQDLVDYAMYNEYETWFPLLCDSCTYVVNQYIKSARHRLKE